MLKSNVAWSTNKDSYTQGKESAQKAVVDLIQTKVAFLYTSVDCNIEKVLEGAKSELGTAPIIGCIKWRNNHARRLHNIRKRIHRNNGNRRP